MFLSYCGLGTDYKYWIDCRVRNDTCAPVEQNALREEVDELQYRQEQLECHNASLLHQVDRLKEEKEEREREAVSYCNALEV